MCRVLGLCSDPAVTDVVSFTTELSEPLLHLGEVGVSSILDPMERTQVKPRCASQRLLPFVPPEVASRAGLSNASGRVAFSRSRRHSSVESRCEGPGSITGGRSEPSSVKAAVTKLRPFTPQNSDLPQGTVCLHRADPRSLSARCPGYVDRSWLVLLRAHGVLSCPIFLPAAQPDGGSVFEVPAIRTGVSN